MHSYAGRIDMPAEHECKSLPLHSRLFLFLSATVLSTAVVGPIGYAICAGLAVYALKGAKESVEALSVLGFLIILNKDLSSFDISLVRWPILFAAALRLGWESALQDTVNPPISKSLFLLAVVVLVLSLLVSSIPAVSVLKIVSFTMGVGSILVGLYRTAHLREYWLSWFITMALFIIFASLPMYATSLGYGVRGSGTGFRGILNHPQTYGPVLSPLAALLTGLALFEGKRTWPILAGAALAWSGIYMSESRTALLSLVLGCLVAGMVAFMKSSWRIVLWQVLTRPVAFIVLFCVLVVGGLYWNGVAGHLTEFLLKDEGEASVTASLEDSRGGLIKRSLANFRAEPITGIGFGVPSEYALLRVQTGALGMPTSASTEKGFMPSAVLEEVGIVGAIFTLWFILCLVMPVISRGSITILWTLSSCLAVNFGEMVFFSVGGTGLFLWLLMGFCYMYAISAPRVPLRMVSCRLDSATSIAP